MSIIKARMWSFHPTSTHRNQHGFTIPELLAVIGILALLAAISLFFLRPDQKDVERRNAERQLDIAMIAQVLGTYKQKTGHLPADITTSPKGIGSGDGQANLCATLVPQYMTDIPFDPVAGTADSEQPCNVNGQQYDSGYAVFVNTNKTAVTVTAPNAEDNQTISVTKQL